MDDDQLHDIVIEQLEEYFTKKRKHFNIPLLFTGTDFQKEVWNELLNIPYGQTISYLTLSRKLQKEKAIRAVASANGANAISILVPCHRVIATDGKLTGYAGGLTAKKKLLQLEGALNRGQLDLF
ncbi:methylated-DNA--[protein]-cysteine S-methyltransferase [Nonlabens mediterrranea]|uniref:Methylated-DNA--[protein]-cysteine S-methyltransferase n=1 Tax=Nonlabens mediterrranea TaxID=1419947 RepID=A0ABS0A285_9FLAO|nr:methylated-DNA--[protein]-cysteine S-methyltransferase [Nonlabens mediterrranea]